MLTTQIETEVVTVTFEALQLAVGQLLPDVSAEAIAAAKHAWDLECIPAVLPHLISADDRFIADSQKYFVQLKDHQPRVVFAIAEGGFAVTTLALAALLVDSPQIV